jgi:hypothetical protein
VNALAQSRPDQRGSGDFPKTAVKIALSKSMISATVGEAAGSGSYKSREEPRFQQDAGRELQRLVSNRRICDLKWIFYEADATGLKQGRAVSRTVGLEHERPLTANPYRPSSAAHFLDTDRTKSIHRSPLYKSMRRDQLPIYRPQDPFHR